MRPPRIDPSTVEVAHAHGNHWRVTWESTIPDGEWLLAFWLNFNADREVVVEGADEEAARERFLSMVAYADANWRSIGE